MAASAVEAGRQAFKVVPFNDEVGAEIVGIDLSRPLDDAGFGAVRDAFFAHGMLVFRDQKLTEGQQIEFSRRFGELEIHVLRQFLHARHPEILLISNIVEDGRNIGIVDAGRYWHTDLAYKPVPSMGSLLYAIEVPRDDAGQPLGDTLFASVAASYDALPEALKRQAAGLKALNSLEHTFDRGRNDRDALQQGAADTAPRTRVTADQKKLAEAVHPVIRTHPVTGRKCLYVNDSTTVKIVGMPEREGDELLKELRARAIRPGSIYRHKWRVGDLVMWDNCSTQHQAVANYELPRRRLMHRTTVKGTAPF